MDKKKGFTLIEIIMVVGIMAIVIGGSVRIYQLTFFERQLEKEADQLMNVLQRVKQRTIARDISPLLPTPGCTTFQGYAVVVRPNETYRDQIVCDSNSTTINAYTLDALDFNGLSSDLVLLFTYPYGSLTTNTRTVQIRSARLNRCITITIPQLGPIHKSEITSC